MVKKLTEIILFVFSGMLSFYLMLIYIQLFKVLINNFALVVCVSALVTSIKFIAIKSVFARIQPIFFIFAFLVLLRIYPNCLMPIEFNKIKDFQDICMEFSVLLQLIYLIIVFIILELTFSSTIRKIENLELLLALICVFTISLSVDFKLSFFNVALAVILIIATIKALRVLFLNRNFNVLNKAFSIIFLLLVYCIIALKTFIINSVAFYAILMATTLMTELLMYYILKIYESHKNISDYKRVNDT